ncbi:MAG: hypothetical protein A2921_03710 [Candidatus Magasanikbacteria bacterium RIFCSPLOWO2_01_FULL_43_20b]|uniref:Cytochrome C biogenesis protein n=1 Tax=Candidatus Magasanikbacteria bacterium RIFCSPLOWO2_12_FULL_43_12 TaxID=1798692 RepID=A0A1F6MR14_9BACT|nr:MAG: hypothetical protein A3C74_00015 [Candidatus Magasanikbacteria bacterium RIFCSPHIGHO2_02_FULL_44_13]OGH72511.1 MAG: hypothetical protein A3I93_04300 [Candidatus Magasanikbacteria bacterium RIFCSPLOWO2_02_FULL_43_22]OGH73682.1 MAG: hypothetical protein A2921_03710 [Candidatus Magasanikbacteria bacterium RIFCSPLOWO2_01_FULL_43_20b]OGH74096.1 MAG: hypothetical protein A3G00_04970 [Candidatus Magasanikbacteria bacterium RIFCSPLOWO2_12_FULL_43_12]
MLRESEFVKIRVTVPRGEVAEKVRQVLGEAGAGVQGNYDNCSFSYPVVGRFRPLAGANPAIGSVGKLEEVEEEMIEMLCHKDKVEEVIAALKKAHPYEEPAIDIIPRLEVG